MSDRSGARTRRRPAAVLLGVLLLAVGLLVRLVDVQVVQAHELQAQSKDRRDVTTVLPGPRGDVLDADGTVLATTVTRYRVTAVPRLATASHQAVRDATRIAAALGLKTAAVRTALTANPAADYALIAPRVTATRLDAVKRLGLDWLYYDAVPLRTYPAGAVAANLVGFVNADGRPEAGIEYGQDACLAGTDGSAVAEAGLDRTPIPGTEAVTEPARPGGSVRLTIDRDLQYYAQQQLAARARAVGAKWGTVVVEEVRTGRLLAVADWPTVNPNHVAATADRDAAALGSRAFTAPYEPGSTMKPVTASMLLDRHLATPASRATVPDELRTADGADVSDSEVHGTERLTLTGVLVQSSNVGISELGSPLSSALRPPPPAPVRTADAPRYGGYVALDDAVKMNTSQAAAPVWRAVTARALQAGGVVPSGTASPDLPATW